MEKLPQNEHFNCPMSKFVREDIIELMEIFIHNCKRCEFIIGGYKLNTIDDINQIPLKEVTVFKFQGYDPYIYIESYEFQCRLYLSDVSNVLQQGMKSKIVDIFKKNRTLLSYFRNIFFNIIAMLILGCVLGQLIIHFFSIGILLTTIIAILLIYTFYYSMNKYTIIYPKKSKMDFSLWEKYGEGAVVTFIITLIAGVVVALITKFI